MKIYNISKIYNILLGIICIAGVSWANPPKNIKHTNITPSQFSISWITDAAGTGAINYGTTTALGIISYDDRGQNIIDDVHHITVVPAKYGTTYYYDIISGGLTYDNGGNHFKITTPDTSPWTGNDLAWGTITKLGNPAANSCILYLRLQQKNTANISAERSILVPSNGKWFDDLINFRTEGSFTQFKYALSTYHLILFGEGAGTGAGSMIVDINDPPLHRPTPDLEIGSDITSPYLYDPQPAPNASQVNGTTNITLHLRDRGYGVGSNTMVMKVNGGTVTPSKVGTPQDYYLFYTPAKPFEFGTQVKVSIFARDLAPSPNTLDITYTFTITSDIGSPTITGRLPAKNAVNVPVDTNIIIYLQDTEGGIATSTIMMKVEGERVYPQISGNLPKTCTITYDPAEDFKWGQEVDIYLEVVDFASNMLHEAYTFTTKLDKNKPKISGHTPPQNEINVSIATPILFNITDGEAGVATSTILFKVNGATITTYSLNEIPQGYSLYYDPPIDFAYGQIVEVNLEVEDLATVPNKLIEGYTFTTTNDIIPPKVVYRQPDIRETQVPVETNITVSIGDDETGVNKNSIVMFVNGENVAGKLNITGTKAEYRVTYDPQVHFEYNQVISVIINASDLSNNPMPQDAYTFTTKLDTIKPYITDHYPDKGTTGAKIDTSIMYHLRDNETGVNQSTLIFYVEGVDVSSRVIVTGTKSDCSVFYKPQSAFNYNQEVNVIIKVTDFGSNTIEESYSFTTEEDTIKPRTSGHNPAKGATEVERATNISLIIADDESGISLETVSLEVNGIKVPIVSTPISPPKAYLITYNPSIDFGYNETVAVSAAAKDKSGNIATETYTFTTISDKKKPYTTEHQPPPGAIDVPVNTNIVLSICDDESGVVRESILLKVNNAVITTMSVFPTWNGFTLIYDPTKNFNYGEAVRVYVEARDKAGNFATQTYTFTTIRDITPPYTSDYIPLPFAGDVPLNTDVILHIRDDGVGVDEGSIMLEVNGIRVIPVIIPPGYNYTLIYRPPEDFGFNEVVRIKVEAKDLAGNIMPQVVYTFTTTIDNVAPYITDQIPAPLATQIAVDTNIWLHIKDNGAGVNQNTILMKVNGEKVTPSISGGKQDYTLFYDPTYNFKENKRVYVYIKAMDLAGVPNVLEQEYFFTTMDTKPPYTTDHYPPKGSTTSFVRPDIGFHLKDDGIGVNIATLKVIINGATITANYEIEGTTTRDFTFTYHPQTDFECNQTVWVTISAEDFAKNILNEVYQFLVSDTMPPWTQGHNPNKDSIGVLPETAIEFHLKDIGTGVNRNSIQLWINNKIESPDIIGNAFDYIVRYKPPQPFKFGEIITVTISALDLATPPNHLQEGYTFTITTDITPPYITQRHPTPGTIDVNVDTKIMFWIRDDTSGVDTSSIRLWVEGSDVTPQIKITAITPPKEYKILYNPAKNFNFSKVIEVKIETADLTFVPNHISPEFYTFTTKVDTTPPELLWVTGKDTTHLVVFFEDENSPMKHIDTGNFIINESRNTNMKIKVYFAMIDEQNPENVNLVTDPLKTEVFYTLVVRNVTDAAGNVILPPDNRCEFSLKGAGDEGIIEKEDKTKVEFLPNTFFEPVSTIEIGTLPETATITKQANNDALQNKEIRGLVAETTREFIARKDTGSETLLLDFRAKPKITIPYSPSPFDQEERIFYRIYQLKDNRWILVPGKQEVDVVNNTVSVDVPCFGIYRVVAAGAPLPPLPPNKLISQTEVFPNPFKPSARHSFIYFRNFEGAITIRIFNIAGELMRTLEVPAGAPQPYPWDVKDEDGKELATGVYIYVITNSGGDKVSGKVSVIR